MTYDRQKFLDAAKAQLEPNIFKHSLALEACMGGLYDYFQSQNLLGAGELSKEEWMWGGLIHDIDFAGEFKEQHPGKTREALAKYGLEIPDHIHRLVLAHAPDLTGVKPSTKAEWSIFCADSLTGLITAVTLVYPTKKLADVKLKSVAKRFHKEPKFAAGTRRQEVAMCANPEGLNLPVDKFMELCLSAMQRIAPELGL